MHLALKHQDQFVVLFGTEEHLVVLILILLYRSWNIKYIFYLSCYSISAINFFMQRDFLNVLIMFSPSYTSVVSTKYERALCVTIPQASFMQLICSSKVQVILTNSDTYYRWIRRISQQTHFTTEIRNILTVCSAYHSESTFLSYAVVNFSVLWLRGM